MHTWGIAVVRTTHLDHGQKKMPSHGASLQTASFLSCLLLSVCIEKGNKAHI